MDMQLLIINSLAHHFPEMTYTILSAFPSELCTYISSKRHDDCIVLLISVKSSGLMLFV